MSLPTPQVLDTIYRLGGTLGCWRINWNGTIHALRSGNANDWFDLGHGTKAICGVRVRKLRRYFGYNSRLVSVDVVRVCGRCARIGKLPT